MKKLIYFIVKYYFNPSKPLRDYFMCRCSKRNDVYSVIGYLTKEYAEIATLIDIDWSYNVPCEVDPYCIEYLPNEYYMVKDKKV